jgi:putative GTP pyrophosphokinase
MFTKLILAPDELKEKAIEFYSNYYSEFKSYKNRTINHLQNLVNAYSNQKNLAEESINILARTKTFKSLLRKLKYKGWPQFDYLPEIVTDLIGTRIICLYLDDCYGIEKYLKQSESIKIIKVENYIDQPKKSG